jgi:hypothetical protein
MKYEKINKEFTKYYEIQQYIDNEFKQDYISDSDLSVEFEDFLDENYEAIEIEGFYYSPRDILDNAGDYEQAFENWVENELNLWQDIDNILIQENDMVTFEIYNKKFAIYCINEQKFELFVAE